MPSSSQSELEKETGFEKEVGHEHLTEGEEELIEAGEPPFTEQVDGEEHAKDGEALTQVPSRHSVNNVRSIPNGGLKAWLQVVGVFFVFFNTWGIVNAVSCSNECTNASC